MPGRTFRPYGHNQIFLLPPSLREWLPADLDLTPILTTYGGVTRGAVPFRSPDTSCRTILLQSRIRCCDEPSALVVREA
ncbi:MAG: hypothetical protein ACREIJ_13935 [Nitrospiraceae bacterium]